MVQFSLSCFLWSLQGARGWQEEGLWAHAESVAGLGLSGLSCCTRSLTVSVHDKATGQTLSCWPFLLLDSARAGMLTVLLGVGMALWSTVCAPFNRGRGATELCSLAHLLGLHVVSQNAADHLLLTWFSSLSAVTVSYVIICLWSVSRILKHIVFVHFVQFHSCLLSMSTLDRSQKS